MDFLMENETICEYDAGKCERIFIFLFTCHLSLIIMIIVLIGEIISNGFLGARTISI